VADIVFAFDAAIDRPIAIPEAAPAAVANALSAAPLDALRAAAAAAQEAHAKALVLFGRVLDPHRASPAQAAALRGIITALAADGCHTVWLTDDATAGNDIARILGDPRGLCVGTPLAPVRLDIRGLPVEIVCGRGDVAATDIHPAVHAPAHRRVIVGWDTAHWSMERWDEAGATSPQAFPAWQQPGCHAVWGSRRVRPLPPDVQPVAALQPRSAHDTAGSCTLLSLLDFGAGDAFAAGEGRGQWRTLPTQRAVWRTLTVASASGGDEELATAIWSALESLPRDPAAPLEIVRCSVECGTSVARRVRVAEIAAETLARVRELLDQRATRAWCHELCAHPGESLAPLGHARSGGRPGSTTSFSSALADIVLDVEHAPLSTALPPGLAMPADMAREAGWLALELIESA
jgi:hypothetical protein